MSNPAVYASLSVVHIRGFKAPIIKCPDGREIVATYDGCNQLGTMNWFLECHLHGFGFREQLEGKPGIIEVDWDLDVPSEDDHETRDFTLLADTSDVDEIRTRAERVGYQVVGVSEVGKDQVYGTEDGWVSLSRHPDGWMVL